MKLILHAGTHKTASTSFQNNCFLNSKYLNNLGIHYPKLHFLPKDNLLKQEILLQKKSPLDLQQHSFIPRFINKGFINDLKRFFLETYQAAKDINANYVLCSGEDMENCLVDLLLGREIVNQAKIIGFKSVEWIFIKRKSVEYYFSLYSQLAKQRITCDPITMIESIENNGYLTAQNMHGTFYYVFDLINRTKRLEDFTDTTISVINFHDFINISPGYNLIKTYSPMKSDLSFFKENIKINTTKKDEGIEIKHLFNFLSLDHSNQNYYKRQNIYDEVIRRRKYVIESGIKPTIESRLSKFD
ncbi:hypothetical protein [Prochlorococcus marinus]|uniref:Uncharacterized protein n=1 Tax=Prochlorococcus marinus XMU1408 TaxID=2213228 RepID=A0A318R0Y4_PROMR|nr:hypothetical protein [Prochlorococcus marinus]MBW3042436.1 hypothetical protein [Prochlorococcus marinus str. XMU1408]PYE01173.1 hypothetical protein DNJ73_07030 [Prochlorococcus marinus XMU1408]